MENTATMRGAGCATAMPQAGGSRLPLSFAGAGSVVTIAKIRGKEELRHHLKNLGFVEGATVKVVTAQSGDLIVEVKGSQVALNCQVATHIITA